jgi:hypothetical protein
MLIALSLRFSGLRFDQFSLLALQIIIMLLRAKTYHADSFLPVFAGFYQFFPLSWQKYFLPWQKANRGPKLVLENFSVWLLTWQ